MNIDGSIGNKYQGPQITRPFDFGTDAIEKTRVSQGQSLIDADFEYGLQATKWQTYSDIRKIPAFYEIPGTDFVVTAVTTDGATPSLITVTCTTQSATPAAGNVINIQGLFDNENNYDRAQGFFILASGSASQVTYYAKGTVGIASESLFTSYTTMRKGGFYSNGSLKIPISTITVNSGTLVTFTTSANHGLISGTPITITGTWSGTGPTVNGINGNYIILTTANPNTFTIQTINAGGGPVSAITGGSVYIQPYSQFVHRPYDGGVLISPGVPAFGASVVRQSKKVFRYQSGKGLMWSSGTLFCPNNDIISVSASGVTVGSTITITTSIAHGAPQAGAIIVLKGIATSGYNGSYTLNSVLNSTQITVLATQPLGNPSPVLADQPRFVMSNWHGASVRVGTFDDQNGIFWEWDGQTLWVVKRSSTFQIIGSVTATQYSQAITGSGTRFADQLKVGDKVTIKGMTYTVTSIASQLSMTVNPPYRGISTSTVGSTATMCKIKETRTPQSQFNRDTVDGNGSSGFKFDPTKMQMMGLQYTWYGAGFIDFMVRGGDGNWVYAHRYKQNNINDEAYMRTGNMSVRYELINETGHAITYLSNSITSGDMVIRVNDPTTYWPTSGTLLIDNEFVNYSSKGTDGYSFNVLGRGASLGGSSGYNILDVPYTGTTATALTAGAAAAHSNLITTVITSSITATALTVTSNVATLSFATQGAPPFIVGNSVTLGGTYTPATTSAGTAILGSGYIVLSCSTTQMTFALIGTGYTATGFGTVAGALPVVSSLAITGGTGTVTFGSQTQPYIVGNTINLVGFSPTTTSTGALVNSTFYVTGCNTTTVTFAITGTYTGTQTGYVSGTTAAATVMLVSQTCCPSLTHWGSAFIMDGLFDQDRGYLFNYQLNNLSTSLAASSISNLFLLRLSPSVSNGTVGDLGVKELLNRAQLLLQRLDVWVQASGVGIGSAIISGILNPSFATTNATMGSSWVAINSSANGSQPSFAQIYTGTPLASLGAYVSGSGERVFSTIVNAGSQYSIDLSGLKEICNGTIGGNNFFPDGPDTLLVQLTVPVSGTTLTQYSLNLFWGEAQA